MILMRLIFFSAVFSSISQADIIFIDLNGSIKEVKAAKEAAAARGEKIYIIPKTDLKFASRMNQLMATLQQGNAEIGRCQSEQCSVDINRRLAPIYQQYADLTEKSRSQSSIEEELKRLKEKGVNPTALIISGHDGNGDFFGYFGQTSSRKLASFFEKEKPYGDSIRSLYLWGCYTSTVGSIDHDWRRVFPNSEFIAGFDGSAPLGTKDASSNYLKDSLIKEKEIIHKKDIRDLDKAFRSLKDATTTNAAVCVGRNLVSNKKRINLDRALEGCPVDLTSGKIYETYKCYRHADAGCESPPSGTSTGPLREYYNIIQAGRHCRDLGIMLPDPSEILRLIFFNTFKVNYAEYNKKFLSDINSLIDKLIMPSDLKINNLGQMSRKDIISQIKAISEQLNKMGTLDSDSREVAIQKKVLNAAVNQLDRDLIQLSPSTPVAWIEPGGLGQRGYTDTFVELATRSWEGRLSGHSGGGMMGGEGAPAAQPVQVIIPDTPPIYPDRPPGLERMEQLLEQAPQGQE